jgi:hypothetical protein
MKNSETLWAISFFKMGINVAGIPIKWIIKNSRIWTIRLTTDGYHRVTTTGKIRVIKE